MDNFYNDCPPIMDDGRFIREFQNETKRNEYIKSLNGIWRDDHYRLFLQQNGQKLMDKEWSYHSRNHCFPNHCIHNSPTRSSNRNFINERNAHDSIFNQNNNKQYDVIKKCPQHKHFRIHYPN